MGRGNKFDHEIPPCTTLKPSFKLVQDRTATRKLRTKPEKRERQGRKTNGRACFRLRARQSTYSASSPWVCSPDAAEGRERPLRRRWERNRARFRARQRHRRKYFLTPSCRLPKTPAPYSDNGVYLAVRYGINEYGAYHPSSRPKWRPQSGC
jgi:hypothetical protein